MTVGVNEIAKALDVTTQHVARLVQAGMPRVSRGAYELGPCMLWYIRYLRRALEARSSGEDGSITSLTTERTRQAAARTEAMERENLIARGELVYRGVITQQEIEVVAIVKRELSALAARIPTDEATKEKIDNEAWEILGRLADAIEKIGGHRPRVAKRRRNAAPKEKKHANPLIGSGAPPSAAAGEPTAEAPAPDPDPDKAA
jgi:phage terminase Nu1 subunit (DNA packaging protein)